MLNVFGALPKQVLETGEMLNILNMLNVFVKVKGSRGLTWLKSKGSVAMVKSTLRVRSLSHWHCIISQNRISGIIWFCLSSFHSLPWICVSTPLLSLSSSRVISIFDMVAEQADSGPDSFSTSVCPSCQVTTTTVTTTRTITSSSGEKEKNHWSSKLQEEPDIKMFSRDPKLNLRLPSPTSFDGVKPSYVEWSEEILTFLSVTDYQEFVPILQAVTGHKDVITKKVFIEGVLSEIVEEIKEKNTELEEVTSGARIVADQDAEIESIKGEIKTLEEKRDSRGLTLIKADNFLRYALLHSTSGDPNVMVRRIMRTTSSDSEVVTGLEIWRQMAVTYAGSAQTRVVTLLKQIMTPSEWNPEKSSNVLQLYHHWLELISKYESLSSEKIAPSIKITLALQNVRGSLANALQMPYHSASLRSQHGMTLTISSSTTSTTASHQTQRRSISSTSAARSPRRIQWIK